MQEKPVIILVKPQLGENIGMAARAMLNFGLTELRLVAPREDWPNAKAKAAASGADRVLGNAQLFETVAEAIADLQFVYATTARSRDMLKIVHSPVSAAIEIKSAQGRSGIMFGAERTGLENQDVALADAIITYPVNPDFASLNLAQSVLVMAYELSREAKTEPKLQGGQGPYATKAELDNFLSRLFEGLDSAQFFKTQEMRPAITQNITNLFSRTKLSQQELNTLHGIVAVLGKIRNCR